MSGGHYFVSIGGHARRIKGVVVYLSNSGLSVLNLAVRRTRFVAAPTPPESACALTAKLSLRLLPLLHLLCESNWVALST